MFAERSKTEWRLGFFAPRSSALRRTIIKSFTSAPLVLSNTSDLRESPVFSSVNMDTVGLAGQISADWAVGWRLSSWTGRERPEPVVLGDFQLAPMDVAGQGRRNGARSSGEDRCRVNRLWPAEGVRATGGIRFFMKQTSTGGSLSPGESVWTAESRPLLRLSALN